MLNILIIDDEIDTRRNLKKMLDSFEDIQTRVIAEADSLKSGVDILESCNPDIVFLDINLGDGSGFELLDYHMTPKFKVVFVSAYDSFALKAFKYSAVDYLLKPIDPELLKKALSKTSKAINRESQFQAQLGIMLQSIRNEDFNRIALSTNEGITFLKLKDILFLKADGAYTEFHCVDEEKYVVSKSIKEYENILTPSQFFRVHQSYIVNIEFVKKYVKEDGGYALLDDNSIIPISRRRKELFLTMILGKN